MTSADLHPAIREALALHESFRRLGFMPEEIFVRPPHTGHPFMFVTVQRAGKEFNCVIDHIKCEMADDAFKAAWGEATAWWNSATEGETRRLYKSSRAFAQKVGLVMALVGKGFSVRRADA